MPENLIKDYFEGHVESVTAFSERVSAMPTRAAQQGFQEICLLGLNDSKVGLYSNYHDYAVWKYGLDNEKSVRMAYMYVSHFRLDVPFSRLIRLLGSTLSLIVAKLAYD
jgi:hypothetical protein